MYAVRISSDIKHGGFPLLLVGEYAIHSVQESEIAAVPLLDKTLKVGPRVGLFCF